MNNFRDEDRRMLPEVAEAWDNRLNIQVQVAKVDFWLCLEFADLEHCLTRTGLQVLPFNDEREKKKEFRKGKKK